MQSQTIVRRAAKAGSWYESNPEKLGKELDQYLANAENTLSGLKANQKLKALIGPHAGFFYSGPAAAWAYKNIDPTQYSRVVLLGPSHSLPFQTIGLTTCDQWATPFGNFIIDQESTQNLLQAHGKKFI